MPYQRVWNKESGIAGEFSLVWEEGAPEGVEFYKNRGVVDVV